MLANIYFNYIYPGFFKVIAPVEVKLVLGLVIVAALLDLLHRFLMRPSLRTTDYHTEPRQYTNGHIGHTYFDPLHYRTHNNNSTEKLDEKVVWQNAAWPKAI